MYCPKCGNQSADVKKFCPECGFELENVSKKIGEDMQEPPKKKDITIYLVLFGLAAILVGVSIYYFNLMDATLHTFNGISTSEVPTQRAIAWVSLALGMLTAIGTGSYWYNHKD